MAFLLGLPFAVDIILALLAAACLLLFGRNLFAGTTGVNELQVDSSGNLDFRNITGGLMAPQNATFAALQGSSALLLLQAALNITGPAFAAHIPERIRDAVLGFLAGPAFSVAPDARVIAGAIRAGVIGPGWSVNAPPWLRFPHASTGDPTADAAAIGAWLHSVGVADAPAGHATADAAEAWLRSHGQPVPWAPAAPAAPGPPTPPEDPNRQRRPQIPGPPFIPGLPDFGRPGAPSPTAPGAPEAPLPGAPEAPGAPYSPGAPTPYPVPLPGQPGPYAPGGPSPYPVPSPPGLPDLPPDLGPYAPPLPYPGQPQPSPPYAPGAPGQPIPYAPGEPLPPYAPPGEPLPLPIQPGQPQPETPGIPGPPPHFGDPSEWLRQLLATFLAEQERFESGLLAHLTGQAIDLSPVAHAIEQTTGALIAQLQRQIVSITNAITPTVNVMVQPLATITEAVDQATAHAMTAAVAALGQQEARIEAQLAATIVHIEDQIGATIERVGEAVGAPIGQAIAQLEHGLTEQEAALSRSLGSIALGEQTITDALTNLIVNPGAIVGAAASEIGTRSSAIEQALAGAIGSGLSIGLSEWSEDDKPDQDQPSLGGLLNICADLRGTAAALLAGSALASLGGGLKGALGAVTKQLGHLNIIDRVLEIALDASLHASHELTVQNVLKECRVRLPSVGAIIRAHRLKKITDADVDDLIGRHGLSAERYQIELAEHTELLPPSEIREFVFRNSVGDRDIYVQSARKDWDWDEARKRLREQGWRDEDIEAWILVQPNLPTPSEFTHFLVRDIYLEDVRAKFGLDEDLTGERLDIALAIARGVGISEQHAKDIWAAHWRLPSDTQGYEMYWRLRRHEDEATRFTEDDLRLLLKHNDRPPFFRPKLEAIAFRPMGRIDIRRAHAAGILKTDDDLRLKYEAIGYDEQTTNLLIEYTKQQTLQSKLQETAEHRRAVVSQAARAFQRSIIGEDELRQTYKALEYADEVADVAVAHAKMQRDLDHLHRMEDVLHKAYIKRIYTREQTVQYLADVHASGEATERLMSIWDSERRVEDDKDLVHKHQELTRATIVTAYQEGTLAPADTASRLTALGYDAPEIGILLRHADLARAQGVMASVLKDVTKAYSADAITQTQFRSVLGTLGMSAAAIDQAIRDVDADRATLNAPTGGPNGSHP